MTAPTSQVRELDGVYLYAIIDATGQVASAIPGVDGASPVHIVTYDGLGCVVSGYTGEAPAALPRERLVSSLLAHQKVVEHFMGGHTVLPVKFGTLLHARQEVRDLLAQGHEEFTHALSCVQDKVEIEVAATWDTGRVLAEMRREEAVVRAREAIARNGQPTVEAQVKLGQLVKALMDRRRDGYRERMVGFLKPLSVDMAPNALLSDKLVMNMAFLVPRDREHRFYAGVEQVDRFFQNEISFRVIGPLPPYSFSTVEIVRLAPEEIGAARQALHLEGAISEGEVKQAYRHLAAWQQRHRQAGGGRDNYQSTKLRQAVQVMLGYCRAQGARRSYEPESYEPERDGAAGMFVIAIKGSGSAEIAPARFGGVVGV